MHRETGGEEGHGSRIGTKGGRGRGGGVHKEGREGAFARNGHGKGEWGAFTGGKEGGGGCVHRGKAGGGEGAEKGSEVTFMFVGSC